MTNDDRDHALVQLKRLLGGAVCADEPMYLSDAYGDLLTFLVEQTTDFGFNLVQCTYCGRDDMPMSRTISGPKPEYACPICYAENMLEELGDADEVQR